MANRTRPDEEEPLDDKLPWLAGFLDVRVEGPDLGLEFLELVF